MTKDKALGLQDRPLNCIAFESQPHAGTVLCGLNALREKGYLLDVTLLAEGEAFQAHRAVLASCSDFFRAMFTDAMRESRQSEIRLNGVTAKGIRLLLDYAYTSRLALDLANVQDVLSAASYVQVMAVVEACSNYLQSQLDTENCVDIATIAETYSLLKLRRRVYRFMSGNLREFAASVEFHRLAPQQLEYLLASDFPVDCPEEEVLVIVLKWFEMNDSHGSSNRVLHASRIFRRIHFKQIPYPKLESVLDKAFVDQNFNEQKLRIFVLREAYRQVGSSERVLNMTPLVNSRGMELAVVKVGGFGVGGISNEITYRFASDNGWRRLTSIPHVEQCNFGTAVLDNELYVVGGCFNQSLQENIHPFGFRYNPRYNRWTTMAPMQRERCRFSLNVVSGRLYAVGGASEADDEASACERYDPAADSWSNVAPMPEPAAQHAGAAWPPGTGNWLYISGGLDRDLVLGSMRCYDPSIDTWSTRSPLLAPRADHVMVSLQNRIYVCGGWRDDAETGGRVLVDTIDAYDVASDTWQIVTQVPTPRYHAGIVGVDTKIYFIGGFHSDVMFDRGTAAIECYDVEADSWMTDDKYPHDVWELACATLYIPKHRDDMEVLADTM